MELPTVDGDPVGEAFAINDRSEAVGWSGDCQMPLHAVLWKDGKAADLGNLGGDLFTEAVDINNWGQVVGTSDLTGDFTNDACLWHRGVMTDLGTLIPASSSLFLPEATGGINDWGQIARIGLDSNGDQHAFLLTPTYGDKDDDTATSATTIRPNSNPGNNPTALHGRAQASPFKNGTPR